MSGLGYVDLVVMLYLAVCVMRDISHTVLRIIKSLKAPYRESLAGASFSLTPSSPATNTTVTDVNEIPTASIQHVFQLTSAHKASGIVLKPPYIHVWIKICVGEPVNFGLI